MTTGKTMVTGVMLPYNKMNGNGRMYSEECAVDMVEQFNKRENKMMIGEFNPYDKRDEDFDSVSLTNASHTIESLYIDKEKNAVMGTIKILATPAGNKVLEMLDINNERFEDRFVVRSRGIGEVDPSTKEVINYKLLSFDIIDKDKDSFKNPFLEDE